MTLTQKLLKENGIEPAKTENQGGNGDQSGNQGSSSGSGGAGAGGNNSDPNLEGKNKGAGDGTNQGGKAGDQGGNPPPGDQLPDEATIIRGLKAQGIDVASLLELKAKTTPPPAEPSPEEKAKLDQQKKNNIRSHALQTGQVTTTELDAFARESETPAIDLAYSLFKKERLAEVPQGTTPPTDKDLRDEFDEANFQYAEATDPKRIRAEKRLNAEVEGYLQQTYPKIYDMEEVYNNHEQTQTQRTGYNTLVDDAVTSLGTEITFDLQDDKEAVNYPVKFSPEQIAEIVKLYKGDPMFNTVGKAGVSKENLALAMKNSFIAKFLPKILSDVATAHASKKLETAAKGRRGIFDTTSHANDSGEKQVSPGVKKILAANQPAPPPAAK